MRKKVFGGDQIVTMTPEEFKQLPEYSCSFPDSSQLGKQWKCNRNAYPPRQGTTPLWFLGEYTEHPNPKKFYIRWHRIRVIA